MGVTASVLVVPPLYAAAKGESKIGDRDSNRGARWRRLSNRDVPFPTGWSWNNNTQALERPKPGGLRPQAWLDARSNSVRARRQLLEFDRGAGSFEVLLELRSVFLRSSFLHDATGFGEVLG